MHLCNKCKSLCLPECGLLVDDITSILELSYIPRTVGLSTLYSCVRSGKLCCCNVGNSVSRSKILYCCIKEVKYTADFH